MATVYNLGISGATSAQVLRDELPRALELKPEWAVVMAGTNDRINSYALVPASEYEANLRRIAEQLASAGIRVMLMTPPPCIEEYLYTRHPKAAYGGHTPADRLLEAGSDREKAGGGVQRPLRRCPRGDRNRPRQSDSHRRELRPAGRSASAAGGLSCDRRSRLREIPGTRNPPRLRGLSRRQPYLRPSACRRRHAGEWDLPGCVVRKTHAPFIGLGDFVLQFFYNYFAFS